MPSKKAKSRIPERKRKHETNKEYRLDLTRAHKDRLGELVDSELGARGRVRKVRLHLGPTNSGKTYDGLQALAKARSGVYAGPLRMLAQEAYDKLSTILGSDLVGLLTGEEIINPTAPVLCCTAEMAPLTGKVLVLDEAHWAVDRERGHAWTRLLLGGNFEEVHVVAAPEAEEMLTHAYSEVKDFQVVHHQRLVPLVWQGSVSLEDIPTGSLLIAFSRKAVLALAHQLSERGRTVSALYGALPPSTRREQIARFVSGETEIVVTTDVVGHGINLPAHHVVFAETSKFDGRVRRDLAVWEAAQIAGRAGRYGVVDHQGRHSEKGGVWALSGLAWAVPDQYILTQAVEVSQGTRSDLVVSRALLQPTYEGLGSPDPVDLLLALLTWRQHLRPVTQDSTWLAVSPTDLLEERCRLLAEHLKAPLALPGGFYPPKVAWPLDGETVWRLITLPVDAGETSLLPDFARLMLGQKLHLIEKVRTAATGGTLELYEQGARWARDLRAFANVFPGVGGITPALAAELENIAALNISEALPDRLAANTYGVCQRCGKPAAPWFRVCESCYQRAQARYDSWY